MQQVWDLRPELVNYRDSGCNLHPACLSCPLPRCQYEGRADSQTAERERRNAAILAAWRDVLSAAVIAREVGMSRRRVHSIIQAAREGGQR